MAVHSNRGENPFEAIIQARDSRPAPSGNYRMDRLQARINAARQQAEKQRDLGFQAVNQLTPEEPIREETITTLSRGQDRKVRNPTARQVWVSMWALVWFVLSITMMSGNVVGGLLVSIPLFFVCLFLANAPRLYAGTFADGKGRNSNGTAV